MTKERNQNPYVNDLVNLRIVTGTRGEFKDVNAIEKVDIYKLFSVEATDSNPNGSQLIETISSGSVVNDDTGKYHIELDLASPLYTIGKYEDVWSIVFEEELPTVSDNHYFQVFPSTWFTDTKPIVHDFSFDFSPNRLVSGSKKYVEIRITPDVPHGTDKQKYYQTLVGSGELYVYLEQSCGECLPEEADLRLKIDRELVTERDGCFGYYFLDTTELDCGIYHIWFELNVGPNVFISDKQPLQIFN